jgi:hypothetical protein
MSASRLRVFLMSFFIFSSLTLFCGCTTRPVALVPSSAPADPSVRGTIPAFGDSCQWSLLGLFPLGPYASTQSALQEAKDDARTDLLTDVTIDESFVYFVLFSQSCVHVEGKGVR